MSKRILALLLALLLTMGIAMPVSAQEEAAYVISDESEFLEFAELCRLDSFSRNLAVTLEADLDLTGMHFKGIPIFCGTFLGNGHTIRGLSIQGDGSVQGFFRYLTDTAVVQELHLEGSVAPGGSAAQAGALAGSNAGQILGCSFHGTVSGSESIGGLVGVNQVTGILEDCHVNGGITGSHFVGGIAGKNSGVIRSCKNDAHINTTSQENRVKLSDITLDAVTGSEAANTATDLGGIAGNSVGVIRSCVNRGDVGYRHMGYNVGGIAGTQSGYIADCVNYGTVQGRKEVGGIAGQMEPTAMIEYHADALQILQRQLDSLGSVVSDTASNVQGGAFGIYNQISQLKDHVTDAKDAVKSLVPTKEDWIPDLDTIQAAQNTLSDSMAGMTQTLRGMGAVTESMVGTLSNNLYALQDQMNAMRVTLGNAKEMLGGSITDVSDKDTETDLGGKVENCVNHGNILADRNTGGIVGAMAMENDLDAQEDLQIIGDNSLNFSSELRCVVRSCINEASVTAGKQNVGGIAGWQSLGLVKQCYNSGSVIAAGAEFAGGISGQSEGYIRDCGAKCQISGGTAVGGIAGSATVVTGCLSMVQLEGGSEKLGAVLGTRMDSLTQREAVPVAANYYMLMNNDPGGIDGVSYCGVAEPLSREHFLAREDLPSLFAGVTVRFVYDNGGETRFTLVPGSDFPEEKIPAIPEKAGYTSRWKGLTESVLKQVEGDLIFTAEYTPFDQVLASSQLRGQKPVLLLQGAFTSQTVLTVSECLDSVTVQEGQTQLEAWCFTAEDALNLTRIRLCMPEDITAEDAVIYLRRTDGTWRQVESVSDGSYLTAALEEGDNAAALVLREKPMWPYLCAGAAAGLLMCVLLWRRNRGKRKKT